jgi:hypothetical protein
MRAVPVLVVLIAAGGGCLGSATAALAATRVLAPAGISWSERAPASPAEVGTRVSSPGRGLDSPLLGSLSDPAPLVASAPTVITLQPVSLSKIEAVLFGAVNPGSQHTTYWFKAGTAFSTWCNSRGTSGTPEAISPVQALAAEDEKFHVVAIGLSGASAEICYEVEAENASGHGSGGQVFFVVGSPTAFTVGATSVGAVTATIQGEVNEASQPGWYQGEYALASSTWCQTNGASGAPEAASALEALGSEDGSFHVVEPHLFGLKTNTEYCADVIALNGTGRAQSRPVHFHTSKAPVAVTSDASATGTSTATVRGEVDPEGGTAEYEVEYAPAASEWCHLGGVAGVASTSEVQKLASSDETFHQVEVELRGLTPGTEYCAALVAIGPSTHLLGRQLDFTTTAVHVPLFTANSVTEHPPTPQVVPPAPECSITTGGKKVRLGRLKAGKGKKAKGGGDTVTAAVSCNEAVSLKLDGVITETPPRKGHGHGPHAKHLALAAVEGSQQAGETTPLTVRIPASAVRSLYDKMKESLALTLSASNANGTATVSASVLLLRSP